MVRNDFPELQEKKEEFDDCLRYSRVVKTYDVDYAPLNLENIRISIYMFISLYLVSFIILLFELLFSVFFSSFIKFLFQKSLVVVVLFLTK